MFLDNFKIVTTFIILLCSVVSCSDSSNTTNVNTELVTDENTDLDTSEELLLATSIDPIDLSGSRISGGEELGPYFSFEFIFGCNGRVTFQIQNEFGTDSATVDYVLHTNQLETVSVTDSSGSYRLSFDSNSRLTVGVSLFQELQPVREIIKTIDCTNPNSRY